MPPVRDEFDFSDLAPREKKVVGPDGQRYVLREASHDAAIRFRDHNMNAGRFDPTTGQHIGYRDLNAGEPLLVSLCLFEADAEGRLRLGQDGQPISVPEARVRGWLNSITSKMYDWVVDNSPGLLPGRKKKGEEGKKDEETFDPKGSPNGGGGNST